MAEEKQFTIPLRKEINKVASYKRSKRAVSEIKKYIKKHMKVDQVKMGKYLNLKIWERGLKKPPHKIKVKSIKEDDYARVELPEYKFEKKKIEEKKGVKEKIQEKLGIKTEPSTQKEKETKEKEKLTKKGKVETKITKPKKEFKKEEKKQIQEKIRSEHIVTESKKTKMPKSRP